MNTHESITVNYQQGVRGCDRKQNLLIWCPQLLKRTPWALDGQKHEDHKDAEEEEKLRIMGWAKELCKATEVRSQKPRNPES